MNNGIWSISDKKENTVLRKKAVPFDFSKHNRKQIEELIREMRSMMKRAHGVGLAANQVGLNFSMFVAQIPKSNGGTEFYAIFNPKIESLGGKKMLREEGCLSVPGVFGKVERYEQVEISYQDKRGKPLKLKTKGLLAHIIQHETDHLTGTVFVDKAKELYIPNTQE
jgi:peptide deformylase